MYVEAQVKRGIQVTVKPQQNDPPSDFLFQL